MKSTKLFMYGLFAVILALSLTGCPPGPEPGGDPDTITYTAEQTGGANNTTTSTGIVFTFSASVGSLNVADITVGGVASKGSATLSGSGKSWTLSTITVNNAGLANVSINKDGIETATKSVTVHKQGEVTPTEYRTIAWNFNGGTPGAGAQHPTQIAKDAVLAEPTPAPTKANSTFGGWYTNSGLTTAYNFASPVTVNLTLYAKWETGSQPPVPSHTHQWGAWTATTDVSIEERVCQTDPTHTETGLTGTNRFTFAAIDSTAYSVSKGTVTSGVIYIPAYYRPDTDSEYLPVTRIGFFDDYPPNTSIIAVHIPSTVTYIGNQAFRNCVGLASITIPASVTYIGNQAFSNCAGLASITIPASAGIYNNAFSGCTSLTSINVDANNPSYVSENGILYNKTKTELLAYPSASVNVNILESVTYIYESAFYGCIGLTGITIPESVTIINGETFSGCTGLASITIPEGVTEIDGGAFWGCTSLTSITIPESVTYIGYNVFYGCTGLTSITIPESVTIINGETFSGCTGLTSITIPESVTYIGDQAFANCAGLTSIIIPAGVTSIGDSTFSDCTSLASITIPASVTSIGGFAFSDCTGLTSITLPNSVTSIGERAFYNCTGLTSITIPAGVTSFSFYVFSGWVSSQTIYVPWTFGNKPSGWLDSWNASCNAQIVYQQ